MFGTAQRLKLHGRSFNIMYNNAVINFVTEDVYFGNLVDNHMTLASNFARAYKKASGRLRLLHNVKRNMTAESAKMVFELMIMPILTYTSIIKTIFNKTQCKIFHLLKEEKSNGKV